MRFHRKSLIVRDAASRLPPQRSIESRTGNEKEFTAISRLHDGSSFFVRLVLASYVLRLHFVQSGVFHYVSVRRCGGTTGIIPSYFTFLFIPSLSLSLSLSLCPSLVLRGRSRKAGAKNRQLPNERQLSGDQLQKGPVRRIRCDRPMSTVQHLWTLSASPTPRGVIVASERGRGEKSERREARVVFVSFAGRGCRRRQPETGNCRFSAERNRRVARERASIKLRRGVARRGDRSIEIDARISISRCCLFSSSE